MGWGAVEWRGGEEDLRNTFLRLTPGTETRHGYSFHSKTLHKMEQDV